MLTQLHIKIPQLWQNFQVQWVLSSIAVSHILTSNIKLSLITIMTGCLSDTNPWSKPKKSHFNGAYVLQQTKVTNVCATQFWPELSSTPPIMFYSGSPRGKYNYNKNITTTSSSIALYLSAEEWSNIALRSTLKRWTYFTSKHICNIYKGYIESNYWFVLICNP